MTSHGSSERVSTGIAGPDDILHRGLIPDRAYLVRGGPGTGKTTPGMHFPADGAAKEETALFITLGEPESQIRQNSATVHIDLSEVPFLDLSPSSAFFTDIETYDVFSPAEVEREPLTRRIMAASVEAGGRPSAYALKKQFDAIRREQFPWTYEVTKNAADTGFRNLDAAFKNFFRRVAVASWCRPRRRCATT